MAATGSKSKGYAFGMLLVAAGLLGAAGSITGQLFAMLAGLFDPNALYTNGASTSGAGNTSSVSGKLSTLPGPGGVFTVTP